MPDLTKLRQLRAAVLTPSDREVKPSVRGFYDWEEGQDIVEPVGKSFLQGFRIAMEESDTVSTMRRLGNEPQAWQGFAAEGAAMAVGIIAAIQPWRRQDFHKLVSISGGRHTYMMQVGLGWSLARLPRVLWPDLRQLDPAVAQLVLDGYGFHEVFFNTSKTLQQHGTSFPLQLWPGGTHQAQEGLMQGIGRGLWFVAGGSPQIVTETISTFHEEFSASLWAGVGLAATYAGGRDADALEDLARRAGPDRPWLAQGSVFAAEARARANTTTPHTPVALKVLSGATIDEAVALTARHRPLPQEADSGDWTCYERWRRQVAQELPVHTSLIS